MFLCRLLDRNFAGYPVRFEVYRFAPGNGLVVQVSQVHNAVAWEVFILHIPYELFYFAICL